EEFEKAAYQLEKPGDFSKPIKTRYGYHIIQLDEKIDIPPFKEIKPKILNRIKRDDRSDIARESFIKQMKDEYNYQRNEKALKDFYKWVDKSVFEGKWQIPSKARDKKIASWANTGITQKEFAEYIDSRQRKATPEDIQYFVDELFRQYEERRILEFENDRLEEKYPEFKALMQEYRDGILLFDLMNKMVWNKAIEDTTGLKRFFQENQDQFQWKERAKAVAFKSEDKNLLAKAMKKLKKGWTEAQVLEEFSDDEKLVLTSESIFAERGENELLDLFNWKTGVSDIKKHNDRYAALQITEIIEAGPKKLEEAKGAAIAAYQTYLENEWIKELKAKYTIKINKDVLYSLQ
ncbi:MAG: peptidylprolyl isomerase, partial [Luteibaculum sp.]